MTRLAILGGGPAGLNAAMEGARAGCEVTLFEKEEIGENIKCAEGYFDSLKLLEKPEAGICFKVKNIIISMEKDYHINCEPFRLWMIDRREWQKDLGEKARRQGVSIKEGCSISPNELKELKVEFDWIIDASGVMPVTSRAYNFKKFYRKNCALVLQQVLEGDFSLMGENVKVGVESHLYGYYWIFPKGKKEGGGEVANVGMGILSDYKGVSIKKELERVIKKEGLENYKIIEKRGGVIPTQSPDKLIYDNIILAGDAAGLASPLHGGGIDLACISGRVAVQEALKGGGNYHKRLWKITGQKIQMERDLFMLWKKMDYGSFEEVLGMVLENKGKITPELLWKYRRILGREMIALKVFIRGAMKMDWQGNFRGKKFSLYSD